MQMYPCPVEGAAQTNLSAVLLFWIAGEESLTLISGVKKINKKMKHKCDVYLKSFFLIGVVESKVCSKDIG